MAKLLDKKDDIDYDHSVEPVEDVGSNHGSQAIYETRETYGPPGIIGHILHLSMSVSDERVLSQGSAVLSHLHMSRFVQPSLLLEGCSSAMSKSMLQGIFASRLSIHRICS